MKQIGNLAVVCARRQDVLLHADRAGLTCQHIFDLRIRERQPCFPAHLLSDIIYAADHAEFQAVRSVSRRDGVVDAHKVHCPAAQIHEEH